jgi:hypothetical protein
MLTTPASTTIFQVESYMNDIIAKMREELRLILRDSVADYPTKPREKWLFDWSSQMILVVNQIYWCQEVEQVGRRAGCLAARQPGGERPLDVPPLAGTS